MDCWRNIAIALTTGSMSSIKRDVKKKVLPRPEAEKIFGLEIQPTAVSVPPDSLERFCSGLLAILLGFMSLVMTTPIES